MELNKLKALILSMRRSKTNMSTKANTLAQAIEDKGKPNMDTHELLSLLKDALTNRHNKEFYAEQLSQVIGEPNKDNNSLAPTFKVLRITMENNNVTPSIVDFKLGDKMTHYYNEDEGNVQYNSYMFFTDDQVDKLQLEEHYNGFEVSDHIELLKLTAELTEGIKNDHGIDVSEYSYLIYLYVIPINVVMSGGSVDITYDGVKYTYDSSNCEVDAPMG